MPDGSLALAKRPKERGVAERFCSGRIILSPGPQVLVKNSYKQKSPV
jgi:hypothetical protein